MTLSDAFRSPSLADIIYSVPEVSSNKDHESRRTRHAQLRASQGAAQSGHPNTPDGIGHVPNDDESALFCETVARKHASPPVSVLSYESDTHGVASPPETKEHTMLLHLKTLTRNAKAAIFGNARTTIRIPLVNFADNTAPAELLIDDAVLAKVVKTPRVARTPEEKEAARLARKNAPRPTLAEKIAKREAALARDKAKLAAQ